MIASSNDPQAAAILLAATERMSGDTLRATILAIRTIRSADAGPALMKLSHSDHTAARLHVVEAWEGTNDSVVIARLKEMAELDESAEVRREAGRVLEEE